MPPMKVTLRTYTAADFEALYQVDQQCFEPALAYSRPDAGHLELRGNFNNLPVMIEMRKVNTSRFTLVSRGFHWSENGGYYR